MSNYAALTEACNHIRTILDNHQPTYRPTDDWTVAADITNGTATALVVINPEKLTITGARTDGKTAWTHENFTTPQDIADTLNALLDA